MLEANNTSAFAATRAQEVVAYTTANIFASVSSERDILSFNNLNEY